DRSRGVLDVQGEVLVLSFHHHVDDLRVLRADCSGRVEVVPASGVTVDVHAVRADAARSTNEVLHASSCELEAWVFVWSEGHAYRSDSVVCAVVRDSVESFCCAHGGCGEHGFLSLKTLLLTLPLNSSAHNGTSGEAKQCRSST